MIVKKKYNWNRIIFLKLKKIFIYMTFVHKKRKVSCKFLFQKFYFHNKNMNLESFDYFIEQNQKKILNFVISNWFYVSRMIFVIVVHSISQWNIERWCWKQEKDREREIKDKLSDKLFNDYSNNNNKTNLNFVIPRIKFFFFFLLWTIWLLCVCLRWFIFKNNDYFEMNLIESIHWKSNFENRQVLSSCRIF